MFVGSVDKLKSGVGKKTIEKAPPRTQATHNSSAVLSTSKEESRPTSSAHTNLTGTTILDSNQSRDGTHDEVHDAATTTNPEPVLHSINVCTVARANHTHLINPSDRATYRAIEKIENAASVAAITILRPPMDFLSALTRGFKNAPKLYGDDTVRPTNNVYRFKSGMATAAREFGLGWYDGITGLVTQPYRGVKKHGAKGLPGAIGKGVGGLILKPSAGEQLPFSFYFCINRDIGTFGVGGYMCEGIYSEIQRHMGDAMDSYIVAARVTQGHEDWVTTTPEERHEMIRRFHLILENPLLGGGRVNGRMRKKNAAVSGPHA